MNVSSFLFTASACLFLSRVAEADRKIAYCDVIPAPLASSTTIHVPVESEGSKCSLKSVFDAMMAQGNPIKGEFESSAIYKQRVEKLMNVELVPGIKMSSPFGVVVSIKPYEVKYDADKEAFLPSTPQVVATDQVNMFVDQYSDLGQAKYGDDFFYIQVSENTISTAYQAQTVMGVSFPVIKETGDIWALHLVPEADPSLQRKLAYPLLNVPAADAQVVKDNLALVIVGVGVNPPASEGFDSHQPTLTEPRDTSDKIHDLWIHPSVAYVVRLDTGAVLATATYGKTGLGLFPAIGKRPAALHRHQSGK